MTYDPTLLTNTFVCRELLSNKNVKITNDTFPDLPELRYLTVCIGYALYSNAQPYRYSNINVINFSLEKLSHPPANPAFIFSENVITMSCSTTDAEIYYRLGSSGSFVKYTAPIEISQDTTVQAYAKLNALTSDTVTQSFVYDDGIDEPVITCDGEYVEINCGTSGSDTYYRVGTSGEFSEY